jgi:hypothetical protein
MRRILLALTVLAFTVPAAEAARRDDSRQQASRPSTQAAQPKAQATRPAASRPQATTTRPQANTGRSAVTTSRQTATRVPARAGDVRTSSRGLVVRSAAAATVSREAVASCTRRNGRTVCGQPRQAASRDSVRGWQSGLMPVDYAQRECPEGTFATLARGHENVVRCMPF